MKSLVAVFLCLGCSVVLAANSVSHRKAVDDLMEAMQAESVLTAWRKRLDGQAIEVINERLNGKSESDLSETQRAAIQRFSLRANASLDEALTWGQLREPIAQAYLNAYTESEVRELLDFYRSKIGQKALRQGPKLAEEINQVMRAQIQKTLPEFQQIGQDFKTEFDAVVPRPLERSTAVKSLASNAPVSGVNPKTGR